MDSIGNAAAVSGADFRHALAEYIRSQARPIDKLGHQPRLYHLTRLVGEGKRYDDDVVYAAAWLHDLGVFLGHRPEELSALEIWDSVCYAMEQAPAVLLRAGFPAEKIPAVVETIRTHQPQADPGAMEGIVLRDADILEQLGSIGIMRIAAKIGRDTRFSTFTHAASALRRNLAELPNKLRLESAKLLAQPRVALLQAFLKELDEEAGKNLF